MKHCFCVLDEYGRQYKCCWCAELYVIMGKRRDHGPHQVAVYLRNTAEDECKERPKA